MFKLCAFVALIAVASAASNPADVQAQTRSEKNSPNAGDGAYSYAIETTNGIAQQESGVGGKNAQGSAAWYAPNGEPIQLSYVADQFGYRAVGSHLPVAPPVPEAILRSLEWIRTHPSAESQPQQAVRFAAQQQFVPQPFVPQQQFVPQQFAAPQQQFFQPQQFF